MNLSEITIGMTATYTQVVTEYDVQKFGEVSGDLNPIHSDKKYAESSYFGKRVAHGMLSASFFSRIFGNELPGPGCLYVGQNLRFLAPVYFGDVVVASVEVTEKSDEKRIITFKTECSVQEKQVITGTAYIFVPDGIQSELI